MATSSMTKDFAVKNKKAFEQLKKDLDAAANDNVKRDVKPSPALSYGDEKLKHFLLKPRKTITQENRIIISMGYGCERMRSR